MLKNWPEKTGQKKEDKDQQTENLQVFLKTGNGPKNEEMDRKMGKPINKLRV